MTARLAQPVAGHVAHLLAVFDGHGGSAAARCTAAGVAPTLEAMLRPLSRPSAAAMDSCLFAAQLQEALVFTSLELHRCFAEAGCTSGCSATLLLVTGAHVTIASLGSSRCTLDAGNGELLDLTADHRISSNPRERLRLLESGCHVAPLATRGFGPALSSSAAAAAGGVLRLWPGGLALSRCIGDFAVGKAVLPLPHIKQASAVPASWRHCFFGALEMDPVFSCPTLLLQLASTMQSLLSPSLRRRCSCRPAVAGWSLRPTVCGARRGRSCCG